ncbi:protein translocase subunit seca2 chloroplastic [Phtheirospermum japonicum]|uniref:Protein translocase subunit seca2 chloroplastic n=1 Tax=Phtheirospermum japonicum TaxID=374723 RepID=A0A830B9D7_9LAMI|nr:protein translocase subunit seca2 chloroplastic [Phtheirospermum japonicum]
MKMFQTPVIEVPTNMPNIREDLPMQAFATARGKWEYVCAEIVYMFRLGRPILVGTTSVENSEYLSALLRERKIPHNVLNARPKYAAREAEIVAQAGRKNAITLSTNMAGRGTDIILGGNPKMLAKEILEVTLLSTLTENVPDLDIDSGTTSRKSMEPSELWKLVDEQSEIYPLGPCIALAYLSVLKDCESHCFNEGLEVKRLGAPRQSGETRGSWIDTVYGEDEMFQKFNCDMEWAVKLISRMTNDEDFPIEGRSVVRQLLSLQINAEKHFFGIRKSLVEFDEVLEEQILQSLTQIHDLNSVDIDKFHLPDLPKPPDSFRGIRMKTLSLKRWLTLCSDDSIKDGKFRSTVNLLCKYLGDFLIASYLDVIQESGYDSVYVKDVEREVFLQTLDSFWRDHLVNMNKLSSAVNVRSFGHRNPLEEYKIDGCRFFISMLSATRRLTVESLLRYWLSPMESQDLFV